MAWVGTGGLGSFGSLPLVVMMVAVMYFLLIVPQKKQKTWQKMLESLKTGDKVTTSGGLRGVIVTVKDDSLIVKTQPDNVKLEIVKSAIAAVTTAEDESKIAKS
jgi:preprotein translocase subunit YajC